MFRRLIHSDWSVSLKKRYCAEAVRTRSGWHVTAARRIGLSDAFLEDAFSGETPVLLGFDFPIGIPEAYGRQTGHEAFLELLTHLGDGVWSRFFDVVEDARDISLHRPFYPRLARKGVRRAELVAALSVEDFSALHRACERRTGSADACALFWTLGGNQVGRGALAGWREIVRPALGKGARIWPYHGTLSELAHTGVTLAETYPALALRALQAPFLRSQSKRNSAHRCGKAEALLTWADRHQISLDADTRTDIESGFGPSAAGEDAFDALVGLFLMIEVVDGRHPAQGSDYAISDWEGWILGR